MVENVVLQGRCFVQIRVESVVEDQVPARIGVVHVAVYGHEDSVSHNLVVPCGCVVAPCLVVVVVGLTAEHSIGAEEVIASVDATCCVILDGCPA